MLWQEPVVYLDGLPYAARDPASLHTNLDCELLDSQQVGPTTLTHSVQCSSSQPTSLV